MDGYIKSILPNLNDLMLVDMIIIILSIITDFVSVETNDCYLIKLLPSLLLTNVTFLSPIQGVFFYISVFFFPNPFSPRQYPHQLPIHTSSCPNFTINHPTDTPYRFLYPKSARYKIIRSINNSLSDICSW